MTLESAYYLSQIVAAFAVASPLLFGGLQMQKNVRTQRHHASGRRQPDPGYDQVL